MHTVTIPGVRRTRIAAPRPTATVKVLGRLCFNPFATAITGGS